MALPQAPTPLTACLDTAFLVDALRGDLAARGKLKELVRYGTAGITPVTLGFLYMGALERGPRAIRSIRQLERDLRFLPFRPRAARWFGQIMTRLRRQGREMGVEDAMIAAIALDLGMRVITRDVAHFSRIEGLSVETY